mmetsp:Transcript_11792/g.17707  ORF Transcript_11792/g.17707 Transcript_11792/m.17707 type:complete len:232 (+) Transcript_11792:3-698(+)
MTSGNNSNASLMLPTVLSESVEYHQQLRPVPVLPMSAVSSTPTALSYLYFDNSLKENALENIPRHASPLTRTKPLDNPSQAMSSPGTGYNSSVSSYTSSVEELQQHHPSTSSYGNTSTANSRVIPNSSNSKAPFNSIYCTPPRSKILPIHIASPPPGSKVKAIAMESVVTSKSKLPKPTPSNSNGMARESCLDPIANLLLNCGEPDTAAQLKNHGPISTDTLHSTVFTPLG